MINAVKRQLEKVLPTRYARVGATLVVALLITLAIESLRAPFLRMVNTLHDRRDRAPLRDVETAQLYARAGQTDQAFALLQAATDQARTPQTRAAAAHAMGAFLLDVAHKEPAPYAIMAVQYLKAALPQQEDRQQKILLHKTILQAAVLLNDATLATNHCEQARALTTGTHDQAELILVELDALIKLGEWDATYRLWQDAADYRSLPDWKEMFAAKEAAIYERIADDAVWFERWRRQMGEEREPDVLRAELRKAALDICERLAPLDTETGDECLFRAARLLAAANRQAEAMERLTALLRRSRSTYDNDVMLMLVRMSEMEADPKAADAILQRALDRVEWEANTVEELLRLADKAEAEGRHAQALQILERCMQAPLSVAEMGALYVRAADAAIELKMHAKALSYFEQVLAAVVPAETRAAALFGKAEVHLLREQYVKAREALVLYLTEFPDAPERGRALFLLVDALTASDAPFAEVLVAVTAAIDEEPTNPQATEVLMRLGRLCEELELFDLAKQQYDKIALLETMKISQRESAPEDEPVYRAMLHSARCLLKMGRKAEADQDKAGAARKKAEANHLLREICYTLDSGPIFAEAAYHWGTIAASVGQNREAERRFALIDLSNAPPRIAASVELEQLLLGLAVKPPEEADAGLQEILGRLPKEENPDLVSRAYTLCFGKLEEKRDLVGMERLLEVAAGDARVSGTLPLSGWFMRLASFVLTDKGVSDFVQYLDRMAAKPAKKTIGVEEDVSSLLAVARTVDTEVARITQYLKDNYE
ncbi:MAG: hypothetical protein JXR37_07770 [Kiritimatiellae bacterium]|nr:hypothetical protein [Kiritimatiellia bacterium]